MINFNRLSYELKRNIVVTRDLFDDAAEFILCYGLHLRSPCCLDRYFILPLSTYHYCYAPGVANGLLGNYPCWTYTSKCAPASLDALQ